MSAGSSPAATTTWLSRYEHAILLTMKTDDAPAAAARRARLAQLIKERRQELRLSVHQAARRAGVARNTWDAAERGLHPLAELSTLRVEAALQWTPGSIREVLHGGGPEIASVGPVESGPPVPGFDLRAEIDRVSRLPETADTKLFVIRRILDLYDEAANHAGEAPRAGAPSL